jgi:hypothetical protein
MDQQKRELRKLKREIKKAGNKKRRGRLKRDLRDNPEEAHLSEERFGRNSSAGFNGLDQDATRRPQEPEKSPEGTPPSGV